MHVTSRPNAPERAVSAAADVWLEEGRRQGLSGSRLMRFAEKKVQVVTRAVLHPERFWRRPITLRSLLSNLTFWGKK